MEGSRQSMGIGSLQALYSIPERKSSRHMKSGDSTTSITSHATPRHPSARTSIPPKGSSTSPIRRPSPVRRAPSRTYIPSTWPTDILASPSVTHSRVSLAIRLSSPVFIGGATVEGAVHIRIDGGAFEKRRKPKQAVSLRAASVTLTGVERCKGRQEIFRVLKSDLLDEEHPPPTSMALKTGLDGCWEVVPSDSILPFCLDLPVAIGPPPYKSKKFGISYWLSASLEFTLAGKEYTVRHSREIVVLTVHDPEKALVNLKHPLSVSDELNLSKKFSAQTVKLTAGIHRQTWISGYPVFIDVHIENRSNKDVRKLELQLEKTVIFHNYSAPSAGAKLSDTLRIPDEMQKATITSTQVADGWLGVRALTQDFRTCQMELPTGLVSIETGRFFGIRFFLNVQITCSFNNRLKVQLPISIVHPNSIDIPPNALAQVAASIEHKHRNILSTDGTGSPYRYAAGQAFKAARRRSYIQLRKDTINSTEMEEVTRMLEGSPRKMAKRLQASPQTLTRQDTTSHPVKKLGRRQSSAAVLGNSSKTHHRVHSYQALIQRPSTSMANTRSTTKSTKSRSSYETIRPAAEPAHQAFGPRQSFHARRSNLEMRVARGLRGSLDTGPRLQRSTSGLGFDDTSAEEWTERS